MMRLVFGADRAGGRDVFQLLDLQEFGPRQARCLRPAEPTPIAIAIVVERGRKQRDQHHREQAARAEPERTR